MRRRAPIVLSSAALFVAVLGATPLGRAAQERLVAKPTGPAGGALTGTYPNPQIAANAVGGTQVDESTLDAVPSAILGGLGRAGPTHGECDPESTVYMTCGSLVFASTRRARLLVMARVAAEPEKDADRGHGTCRLRANKVLLDNSTARILVLESHGSREVGSLSVFAVTPPLGPGAPTLELECNQLTPGAIRFLSAQVTALAVSPS